MALPATQPTLETTRLILRPMNLQDAKKVQELAGHAEIAATTAAIPHPYLDGMAEAWIGSHTESYARGGEITFAVIEKSSGLLVGCISYLNLSVSQRKVEIGYWIGVDSWGKGYCTEALNETIRFGFKELDMNRIYARHMHVNPASGRVMEKAGMKKEGVLRQDYIKNGTPMDMVFYSILREEYRQ